MKDIHDIHIEHYDAKEVETKKESLVKRAASAGGAVVVSLSLFGSASCFGESCSPIVAGGAGSWYHSSPSPVDECECEDCECDDCECTDDECAKDK